TRKRSGRIARTCRQIRRAQPWAPEMNLLHFTFIPDLTAEIVLAAVALCWFGFAMILVVGKKQASGAEKKRNAISHVGFFVQGLGYATLVICARLFFSPFLPMPKAAETALGFMTIAIAV